MSGSEAGGRESRQLQLAQSLMTELNFKQSENSSELIRKDAVESLIIAKSGREERHFVGRENTLPF